MTTQLHTCPLRSPDMLICHEMWGHTRGAVGDVGRCMKHERNLIWKVDLENAKMGPSSHSRVGGGSCVEILLTKSSFESPAVNLAPEGMFPSLTLACRAMLVWLGVFLLTGYEKGPSW